MQYPLGSNYALTPNLKYIEVTFFYNTECPPSHDVLVFVQHGVHLRLPPDQEQMTSPVPMSNSS